MKIVRLPEQNKAITSSLTVIGDCIDTFEKKTLLIIEFFKTYQLFILK